MLKLLIKMQIKDKSYIYDIEEQLITIVKGLMSSWGNDTQLTSINSVVVLITI